MLESLQTLVENALMERLTLVANHVISAEPAAVDKLLRHAGKSVRVEFTGWPSLLPPLPTLAFRITPAGLLEWLADADSTAADLRIDVDASNPALSLVHLLTGAKPAVNVTGDAAFAADVDWLIANLRWDIEDDLAQVVGAAPAHQLGRLGTAIADGVRKAAAGVEAFVAKDASAAPVGPKRR